MNMFNWSIRYYEGQLSFFEIYSEYVDWNSVPETGVVDMTVYNGGYSHVVRGFDNYWISGSYYGCFNNTGSLGEYEEQQRLERGHEHVTYEGKMSMMWKWENPEEHIYIEENVPSGIKTISGVMLPDDLARDLGII